MIPFAIAGAGLGLLKGLKDEKQKKKDLAYKAEITRYSPWGTMKPRDVSVTDADVMGSVMQGGMTGFSMDQNMESLAASKNMQKAQLAYLKSQTPADPSAPVMATEAPESAAMVAEPIEQTMAPMQKSAPRRPAPSRGKPPFRIPMAPQASNLNGEQFDSVSGTWVRMSPYGERLV